VSSNKASSARSSVDRDSNEVPGRAQGRPRYLVAQVGPRLAYAVPAVLDRAGLLEGLYTDICVNLSAGQVLGTLGRWCKADVLRRLHGREIPHDILPKTRSFPFAALRYEVERRVAGLNACAQARALTSFTDRIGRSMVRAGFGEATHLYTMLGDVTPLLEAARSKGITTVTEIYIVLSGELIVSAERKRYPGFEDDPPESVVQDAFAWLRKMIELSDFFVVPSKAVRLDLANHFGVDVSRCFLVPYAAADAWYKLQNTPTVGRILYVGSANLRKGIHTLGEASLLVDRPSCYEFRVAGDASSQVRSHPLCRNLNFLGRVARIDVCTEYRQADIFVLPSLVEGSAAATYEALAAGVPVITTEQAGSVVRNGEDGFIVPASDPHTLAQRILQLVGDRPLRTRMAASARERAKEFTWHEYEKRLVTALAKRHS
jgi:glycosyltransferase involved in cell wall biosynthesis